MFMIIPVYAASGNLPTVNQCIDPNTNTWGPCLPKSGITITTDKYKITVTGKDPNTVYCEAQAIIHDISGPVTVTLPAGSYSCPIPGTITGMTTVPNLYVPNIGY